MHTYDPHSVSFVLLVLAFGAETLATASAFYITAPNNNPWGWRLVPLGLALYFASLIF